MVVFFLFFFFSFFCKDKILNLITLKFDFSESSHQINLTKRRQTSFSNYKSANGAKKRELLLVSDKFLSILFRFLCSFPLGHFFLFLSVLNLFQLSVGYFF